MQLIEVPAKTGLLWLRQGIWLLRKNPLALLTLFLTYLLAMTLVSSFIPVVGKVLPTLFIPGIAVGFMAACRNTIAAQPVYPTLLADGFRTYGSAVAKRLLLLGVVYAVAIALVLLFSSLFDDGLLLQALVNNQPLPDDPAVLASSGVPLAVIAALALYLPVMMLFWFAPVLTAWHDVPPVKAMFFSFICCWRNRGAFIVYGGLWISAVILLSFGLSLMLQTLDLGNFAYPVLMAISILITTALYCSFYATYRGCFAVPSPGQPDLPSTP
ncbi:BPSS1780 family membrane protein [Paraburkholderia bonniea]|uniref:BPSS1780 family membrane protein n=1 Tax=Paraburkholderia bonniea TaxID=2152891 RepID=UPI00129198BE|nr:BPSS1780 family membrane protein [Paraburkholderia bonniea]WJF89378.1 BPSS1780 family membrane protein [Paraburkholderia bonniea]WJF92693.1 BPSS1780 family membrane protein [Paraburkholderia bonniea]